MNDSYSWWQRGVIYQIYPRSFMDADGDGVGDLRGIIARLDYLERLGVDAIWLSPIFPSPMADFGYDISDYVNIHRPFGTLADFDALVEATHRRGMKIILDYVPNHSSNQHPWFVESRSSRTNPRRDWYLWHDPTPDGEPPNNWLSNFGGSAWTYDAATEQYYYHAYLPQQPDLNWRNPEVQAAMLDVMRFWFERGVDGFRVDALRQLIKDEQLRDNPPNPAYTPGDNPYRSQIQLYTTDRPEMMELIGQMRDVSDAYAGRVLIGELYLPITRLVAYYGTSGRGMQLPFNFHLLLTAWDARRIAQLIDDYEAALPEGGWPNWVLGNHDNHRIASRIGSAQACVAAMLLLTLRGTPTLYYGDEIGMRDVEIPPALVQDPWELRVPGLGLGRDPERTPMQWDSSPNAGFSSERPWLPVAADYREVNVAAQEHNPTTLLNLYRRLLALRRRLPALNIGSYTAVAASGDVLAYLREVAGQRILVALNLGSHPATLSKEGLRATVIMSTKTGREAEHITGAIELHGDEGVIMQLEA